MLTTLYEQVELGLGKKYWTDVLEFLGGIFAQSETSVEARSNEYQKFLRKVEAFEPAIFAGRLYSQYERYREANKVIGDPEFERWAASMMSKLVCGRNQ